MASPPGVEDGFTVMAAARSEAPAEWPLLGERLLPARLLAELPGHELLQVLRDLLRGGGHHLRQDDLLRDRQELAHARRDARRRTKSGGRGDAVSYPSAQGEADS